MRKIYSLVLSFFFFVSFSSAQLTTGDIMFVGFMFDGDGTPTSPFNCGDGFAFVCLSDIADGETIYFTEEDYNNGFGSGEGDLSWINDSGSSIPVGTVVQITTHREMGDGCGAIVSSVGTASFNTGDGFSDWLLTSSNEEIYAYQGTLRSPSTWLSALITDSSTGGAGTNVPPAELSGFIVDLTSVDVDADIGVFNAGVNCTSKADCVAAIIDVATNWTTEDGVGNECCDGDGINYPQDLPPNFQFPLPVHFGAFTIAARSSSVVLTWSTYLEIQNEGFEIERSSDGSSWHTLGFVKGQGDSDRYTSYTYVDPFVARGLNFYRLKQMDYDGRYTFSEVRVIQWKGQEAAPRLFPNPFSDLVTVSVAREQRMVIVDAFGREQYHATVTGHQTIDLSFLPAGVYFAQFFGDDQRHSTQRIVRQ